MGKLLICNSCQCAVSETAITCNHCNAQLQKKGLNIIGLIGLLLFLGSIPGCLFVGFGAAVPMIIGLLLMIVGQSYTPRYFVLRKIEPHDIERLKIDANSGAKLTPAQSQLINLFVFISVIFIFYLSII